MQCLGCNSTFKREQLQQQSGNLNLHDDAMETLSVEEVVEEGKVEDPFETPFAHNFLDEDVDVLHPHAYFQEHKAGFSDRFDGAFTHWQLQQGLPAKSFGLFGKCPT
jgi:hypothetical protein